jgi:hypothetical protein
MNRWLTGLVIAVLGLVSSAPVEVRADEAASAGLKAEIELLKERLSALEGKLAEQEAVSAGAAPGAAIISLPSALHGVQMSGFVDTSYTYNFNEPNSRVSGFRVFDTRAEDFMINNAELVVEKPVSAESPLGFRADIDWGTDMEVVGGVTTGLGANAHTHGQSGEVAVSDEVELQQAYAEYLVPVGNGIDVKVGKFVTLHGAEVIEAKDNWNFSRSYLFGYAIPFTHTGFRASYPWNEWLLTCLGINNGWDVVDDNNKGKTVEFSATLTPMENLSFGGTYMFGPEQGGDSHDQRHLLDLVAQYQPLDRLTLKLNLDIAREEDALSETDGGKAHWNGIAAYAKYDLTDKWSVAGRWEVFNDDDGARTAVNASTTSPTGSAINDIQLMEWTLTNEYKLNSHLIARLEYRLDKADSAVFRHDQGFSDYQNTLAVEFIAPF